MALILAAAPALGNAQVNDLDQAAEKARKAWFAHNTAALVAESPRLLIQLPGAEPSVALGPDQAAALLSNFLSNGQEVETVVRAAREVAPSQGYVELQRKYRVVGTQNVRTQVLLLGYRRSQGGWTLVEFRAVG
ncbi:MAG TPA: hypothetical protein VJU17_09095 [Gemmatimonadales bacterium]|nr:hypothetical protein [Gemmatimonadales bacterium]